MVSSGHHRDEQVLQGRWVCDSTGRPRLTWQVVDREDDMRGDGVPGGLRRPVIQLTSAQDDAAAA